MLDQPEPHHARPLHPAPRSRLAWQGALLVLEGALIFIFSNSGSLVASIVIMVVFCFCVVTKDSVTAFNVFLDEPDLGRRAVRVYLFDRILI